MISFIDNPSAYVRENALQALYGFGSPHYVLRAFRIINHNTAYQNVKLLSDGLMSFAGNHTDLIRSMWANFNRFTPMIQVSIVNYIRAKSGDYTAQFYELLKNTHTDKEVRFAVVRYFRKYAYWQVLDVLTEMITQNDENLWEFAAVAASTMQNYPCEETIHTLNLALKSANWYVRFNAADSLIHLGVTPVNYSEGEAVFDKYANEMMEYRWQMYEVDCSEKEDKPLVKIGG